MKLFIASDIHGSSHYCEKLMERYREERPDEVLLLGDILYHGPRNDLPDRYDPKGVITMLNDIADKILCVCGNCDCIYATHGHIYNQNKPMPGLRGILLCGHTHVPAIEEYENFVYLNPGSVSIPKKDSKHSYMVFEDGLFQWKDVLNGEVYQEYDAR